MRVTNEMVERAYQCLKSQAQHRANMGGHEHCYPGGGAIRAALSAALAGVPEPSIDAAEYRRLWGLCQESRLRACNRSEAAEAKLDKVRALTGEWERAAKCNRERSLRDDPYTVGVADTLMQSAGELEYALRDEP